MIASKSLWINLFLHISSAFIPSTQVCLRCVALFAETSTEADMVTINAKEAVKLFGRLAEKYIMLDSTGGMCCYSGCKDCEYRLPNGGYIMADQSAARPKWIPSYVKRTINGKEHISKWSSGLFSNCTSLTEEEFVSAFKKLDYVPPLGGPYVGASAADFVDDKAARVLFTILSQGDEKLFRHKMSVRLKKIANGEEGLTWAGFVNVLGGSN